MKRLALVLVLSLIALSHRPSSALAQSACAAEGVVSSESILNAVESSCCGLAADRQGSCIRDAVAGLRTVRSVISSAVYQEAEAVLNSLRTGQCSRSVIFVPTCTDQTLITPAEATTNIEETVCDRRLQSSRISALAKVRRSLARSRRALGASFVNAVTTQLSALRRSRTCGQGGKKGIAGSCSRIEDPRDGSPTGNVYKIGDHDGKPVFITHNGARSGQALTPSGSVIESLRYTGTANPDANGPRHHYRMNSSCSSLPRGFLLRIGSRCYEIDSPCSRID